MEELVRHLAEMPMGLRVFDVTGCSTGSQQEKVTCVAAEGFDLNGLASQDLSEDEGIAILFDVTSEADVQLVDDVLSPLDANHTSPPILMVSPAPWIQKAKDPQRGALSAEITQLVSTVVDRFMLRGADDVLWVDMEPVAEIGPKVALAVQISLLKVQHYMARAFREDDGQANKEMLETMSARYYDLLWRYIPRRVLPHFPAVQTSIVESESGVGPYSFEELLGESLLGPVWKARNSKTGETFAVKAIKKARIQLVAELEAIYRETRVLQSHLSHPNIVRVQELLHTPTSLYLVREFCGQKDLYEIISGSKGGGIPLENAQKYFCEILAAVDHCHQRNICHRDLKPETICLDDSGHVKLNDFGLCAVVKPGQMLRTPCGSVPFAAPEVMGRGPYEGFAADAWALGVVLLELLCGVETLEELYGWEKNDSKVRGPESVAEIQRFFETKRDSIDVKVRQATAAVASAHGLAEPQDTELRKVLQLLHGLLEPDPLRRAGVREVFAFSWVKGALAVAGNGNLQALRAPGVTFVAQSPSISHSPLLFSPGVKSRTVKRISFAGTLPVLGENTKAEQESVAVVAPSAEKPVVGIIHKDPRGGRLSSQDGSLIPPEPLPMGSRQRSAASDATTGAVIQHPQGSGSSGSNAGVDALGDGQPALVPHAQTERVVTQTPLVSGGGHTQRRAKTLHGGRSSSGGIDPQLKAAATKLRAQLLLDCGKEKEGRNSG
uniref:Protein kinase domain-containing protein n=1 Tax=Chromera velia CCMP2878 TaxID=1169474 RepID=A0A0G4FGQ9_9ALVE|eukprot:Cvel_16944.t1-p1 / transcript=Cvel_16944.t1 / gene=Cvel_16944 / organism=Chromera_velia_CCMP2878 / gene_product=CBL-interacting serine/threonine-protein kinase 15, putative / transcript_product=CBL-interacting serine/threonine-protein kinase 15, putative / location=Cvel_scaffold1329:684-4106(+) / protein_length=722 / sequence_SO=supercontig / SO=protein_coding / is_pseudo=false